MPSYTLTPVRTANFTAADGTAVDTLYAWLDPFPQTNTTGYHTVISNAMKLDFSSNDNTALADLTGTYTNNQYVIGRLGNLGTTGLPSAWIGAYLHCTGGTTAGTTGTFYRLRISQDSGEVPPTTKIYRSTGGTLVEIASTTAITWANGDRFLFIDFDGTVEVYRDSGSGFGSTPVLTINDVVSRLTGGGPGIQIRRPDSYTVDDLEMGDATLGGPTVSAAITGSAGTFSASASTPASVSAAVTGSPGTLSASASTLPSITSEPLKDRFGNLLASTALDFVAVYNDTTGALVLRVTGLSTNAAGRFVVAHASLVAGTTYRLDWQTSTGKRRMPRKAAA